MRENVVLDGYPPVRRQEIYPTHSKTRGAPYLPMMTRTLEYAYEVVVGGRC